jgi:hypothetical protein
MTIDLARAYIGALYDNLKAGRITAEEVRRIEDEVFPRCEWCGLHPQKAVAANGDRICVVCDRIDHSILLFVQHTTEA